MCSTGRCVRPHSGATAAWFRNQRDRLFREHPQSPIPADKRESFRSLSYWSWDAVGRVVARFHPAFEEATSPNAASIDSGEARLLSIGTAVFQLFGVSCELRVLWLDAYGGGVFIPFRDATSGTESYGGGRYLIDSVKGADLGSSYERDAITLDFNYAYHPSCAYDPIWACPLAPRENRLSDASSSGRTSHVRCVLAMSDAGHSAGAVVELRNVTKRYARGSETAGAVNDLSFTVPAGEICVLVGPSGCGKTTTLRMVNRLVEPSSGQVLIDGSDVATVEPTQLRRRIGYVIQQIGLFPHQSIAQTWGPSRRCSAGTSSGVRRELMSCSVSWGSIPIVIEAAIQRSCPEVSVSVWGWRERWRRSRPVMLMDEPFGAVDPIVRERLQDEFLRLHRTLGMTVMLVTHDIDEAIKMGTRVAIMRQGGYLEQYAPPAELLARPASDFVAQFVGADRALKHLALLRVSDLAPVSLAELVDGRGSRVPDEWPRFDGSTLLRDALWSCSLPTNTWALSSAATVPSLAALHWIRLGQRCRVMLARPVRRAWLRGRTDRLHPVSRSFAGTG